jgi:hypothetical protein
MQSRSASHACMGRLLWLPRLSLIKLGVPQEGWARLIARFVHRIGSLLKYVKWE